MKYILCMLLIPGEDMYIVDLSVYTVLLRFGFIMRFSTLDYLDVF